MRLDQKIFGYVHVSGRTAEQKLDIGVPHLGV